MTIPKLKVGWAPVPPLIDIIAWVSFLWLISLVIVLPLSFYRARVADRRKPGVEHDLHSWFYRPLDSLPWWKRIIEVVWRSITYAVSALGYLAWGLIGLAIVGLAVLLTLQLF